MVIEVDKQTKQKRNGWKIFNTVHFHFTDVIVGMLRIPFRIRFMCPVVVVDDVSPMVRTGYVDRIRNRSSGVDGVPKAQNPIFFVGCVRDVDRKPKKIWVVSVEFVWNETCSLKYKILVIEFVKNIIMQLISIYVEK